MTQDATENGRDARDASERSSEVSVPTRSSTSNNSHSECSSTGALSREGAPTRSRKQGTRDPDDKQLAKMLAFYVKSGGNLKATAREFGMTFRRARRIAEDYKFTQALEEAREQTRSKVAANVSDAHAAIVDRFIDPFIAEQIRLLKARIAEGGIDLDVKAVDLLQKLRELVTGGATSRDGLDVQSLANAIRQLSADERRELSRALRG